MTKIEKKFSIKAETDKNFARELEKASQAVYKLPYDSLQELPGDGKPSKHYLRKQYIKNKKFIGLPEDLKQLSNTLSYKSEQAELIIDAYKTLKKINDNFPEYTLEWLINGIEKPLLYPKTQITENKIEKKQPKSAIKKINKVILFYDDETFETFTN